MQCRGWRGSRQPAVLSAIDDVLPCAPLRHTRGGLGGRADYSRVHPENSVLLDPELGDTTALIFWTARARPDGYTIDFGSLSTHVLNGAARHAEAKHPSRERADDACAAAAQAWHPEGPQPSGFPDVIVESCRSPPTGPRQGKPYHRAEFPLARPRGK